MAATCCRWPPVYSNDVPSCGQCQSDGYYIEYGRHAGSGGTEGRVNMLVLESKRAFPFRNQIAPSSHNRPLINETRAHLNRQKPQLYDSYYGEAHRLVAAGPRLTRLVQPTTTQDNVIRLATHFNNNGSNNNNDDDDDSFYAETAEIQALLDAVDAEERFCRVLSYVIVIVIILVHMAKAGYFVSPYYDRQNGAPSCFGQARPPRPRPSQEWREFQRTLFSLKSTKRSQDDDDTRDGTQCHFSHYF